MQVSSGTYDVGSLESDGTLQVAGGSLTVTDTGTASQVRGLAITGGTLGGAGTLNVSESFSWTGGTMSGSGQTVLGAGVVGSLAPAGTNSVWLIQRTLVNRGTVTWSSGSFYGHTGGAIDNQGTLRANSETSNGLYFWNNGTAAPVLINRGLLVKTDGTGATRIGFDFGNVGRIRTDSGRLDFTGKKVDVNAAPTAAEHRGPGNPAMPNYQRTCAGKPVDCATGNQFEVQTDLAVGGRGVGLALVRTYNSQAAAAATSPGSFGYGWTSSFSDRLVVDAAAMRATVHHSDGSSVSFLIASDGAPIAPPRVQSTLTKNADGSYTYVLPDQRRLTFAAGGRLERVADRNANTTTLGYDAAGRLESITDPAGRAIRLAYDGDGRVASATDPTGLKVNYGYESGDLVSVGYEGVAAPQWRFGYDGKHQLTSMTDGRGGTTTTSYDASGRAISQTDALQRTRTWEYLADETRITNPAGDVTVQRFDANRQPVSVTAAAGTAAETTQMMTYDVDLNLTGVTDGTGKTTRFTYDGAGNRTSVTDPNGDTMSWTYDDQRNVTSETSPSGKITTLTYDARGNLTGQARTLKQAGQADQTQATSFDYDGRGQLIRGTDPLGRAWSYSYNDAGDQISETSPSGAKTTWTYDAASRVTSRVAPRGNVAGADPAAFMTIITRDALGRPTDVRDPLGRNSTTRYDGNHNPIEVVDGAGRVTTITYDAENQHTRVERGGLVERTQYDADGRVIAQTNPKDQTTAYDRDAAGRVTRVVDPLGRETTQRYDGAGRLVEVTDALARTTSYSYDPAGRLTTVDYSDAATADVSYRYDADGRRTEMTDATGTSTYSYDSLDRLTSTVNGDGRTIRYGYDLADQQTSLTYPNGQAITREYDASGRMTSITDWLDNTTRFEYDADSNQTATRFPAGTGNVDSYQHDPAGRLASIAMTGAQGSLASISVTRNGASQVTASDWQGLPGISQSYGYDAVGRVSAVNAVSYSYDPASNPTKLGATDNLTYNDADELVQATTPDGAITFDYDELGNRTTATTASGTSTDYQYDQVHQLTSVTRAGEPTITYGYDGDGLRASKTKKGTTTRYAWDADRTVPLMLSEGASSYIYDPNGLPLQRIDGDGQVLYFHHDQLGSTRMLTDADGAVVGSYSYDAYGNLSASTGSAAPSLGYAGEYTDADTGLIYLRARYYDPATGQFLTRDPLEYSTRQPYLYANGDPINRIDPLGDDAFDFVFGPDGVVDDVVPDAVSNAAAGYLDGWTEGELSDAFGINEWCEAPGYGLGNAASNVSVRGAVKGGIRAFAKQQGRHSGRKPDLKQVDAAARASGLSGPLRKEFGKYIEAEKQGGPDFSYQELRELEWARFSGHLTTCALEGAKGWCSSCRRPGSRIPMSSAARRCRCCAPAARRVSWPRRWASRNRRCATGVARTRWIAMSATTA